MDAPPKHDRHRHQERATPVLSPCHSSFTERSIFRFLFPRNFGPHERASAQEKMAVVLLNLPIKRRCQLKIKSVLVIGH